MRARRKSTKKLGKIARNQLSVRLTPRRRAVLEVLMSTPTHPTVRELHELVCSMMPGTALATVYNGLEYLQKAGLVNEHHLDSGPARYCANREPHMHLIDESTQRLIDVCLKPGIKPEDVFDLPSGFTVTSVTAYLHGHVPSISPNSVSIS